jgi:uncharacterized glyoxalase superfamily protein PhnB
VVADVEGQVDFLRAVFSASGEIVEGRPVEIVIGDSIVMITSAESREPFPGFMYVYVANADETYRRAIACGAEPVEPPLDTPYGDRRAMVRDPLGNVFQIAHQIHRSPER